MSFSFQSFFAAAVVSTGLLASTSYSTQAAEVKVTADLGSRVLDATAGSKVYLRLSLQAIMQQAREKRTPVNIALVMDRSGSMNGKRLQSAKEAAKMALNRLGAEDVLSLVAYNHGVDTIQPAAHLTNTRVLKDRIDRIRANGRTALYAGVMEGSRQVREFIRSDRVNRVILLSDGLANVGPATPAELAKLGQELGGDGITVTTIGLGLSYNEDLMSKLALASDGNHAFAETPDDLAKIFNSEFGDVLSVVAQDVTIQIECRDGFKPNRVLGRKATIDGDKIKLRFNQLYGAQEKYVIVELEATQAGAVGDVADVADVQVDYLDLETKQRQDVRKSVSAEFSNDKVAVRGGLNKSVMTQVTTQIANEQNEKAVTLRDKGDVAGAQKLLEANATYLREKAEAYDDKDLLALEKENRVQAKSLTEKDWAKTRKSMRYKQHKSKVQQAY